MIIPRVYAIYGVWQSFLTIFQHTRTTLRPRFAHHLRLLATAMGKKPAPPAPAPTWTDVATSYTAYASETADSMYASVSQSASSLSESVKSLGAFLLPMEIPTETPSSSKKPKKGAPPAKKPAAVKKSPPAAKKEPKKKTQPPAGKAGKKTKPDKNASSRLPETIAALSANAKIRVAELKATTLDTSRRTSARLGNAIGREVHDHAAAGGLVAVLLLVVLPLALWFSRKLGCCGGGAGSASSSGAATADDSGDSQPPPASSISSSGAGQQQDLGEGSSAGALGTDGAIDSRELDSAVADVTQGGSGIAPSSEPPAEAGVGAEEAEAEAQADAQVESEIEAAAAAAAAAQVADLISEPGCVATAVGTTAAGSSGSVSASAVAAAAAGGGEVAPKTAEVSETAELAVSEAVSAGVAKAAAASKGGGRGLAGVVEAASRQKVRGMPFGRLSLEHGISQQCTGVRQKLQTCLIQMCPPDYLLE